MELIDRPLYLDRIEPLIGVPVIKVLTGLRRSGKSRLLELLVNRLVRRGIPPERIVHMNFDSLELAHLAKAEKLYAHLKEILPSQGRVYVLLDEIQEVADWERLVNSLNAEKRFDVYITGSNSTLLSGDLATYIAGRYTTIEVWPLSFKEYLTFRSAYSAGIPGYGRGAANTLEGASLDAEFLRYLHLGGFPGIHVAPLDQTTSLQMVMDIYRSTLVRDVLTRNAIRDSDMFERVAAFAIDNVGNPFSARRVSTFMKSQQRSVSHETVLNYLNALRDAFVISRVHRFDLRGRGLLATDEKHYLGDHGIVSALYGTSAARLPGVLKNIVWMELRRRGYEVCVGKVGTAEVDFVATRQSETMYVQVATTIAASQETRDREYRPLEALKDNYPKYVLTMDPLASDNVNGIRQMRIPAFLLTEREA